MISEKNVKSILNEIFKADVLTPKEKELKLEISKAILRKRYICI